MPDRLLVLPRPSLTPQLRACCPRPRHRSSLPSPLPSELAALVLALVVGARRPRPRRQSSPPLTLPKTPPMVVRSLAVTGCSVACDNLQLHVALVATSPVVVVAVVVELRRGYRPWPLGRCRGRSKQSSIMVVAPSIMVVASPLITAPAKTEFVLAPSGCRYTAKRPERGSSKNARQSQHIQLPVPVAAYSVAGSSKNEQIGAPVVALS